MRLSQSLHKAPSPQPLVYDIMQQRPSTFSPITITTLRRTDFFSDWEGKAGALNLEALARELFHLFKHNPHLHGNGDLRSSLVHGTFRDFSLGWGPSTIVTFRLSLFFWEIGACVALLLFLLEGVKRRTQADTFWCWCRTVS